MPRPAGAGGLRLVLVSREMGSGFGRKFPALSKASAINLGDDSWRCGAEGIGLLQRPSRPPTTGPCRRRLLGSDGVSPPRAIPPPHARFLPPTH